MRAIVILVLAIAAPLGLAMHAPPRSPANVVVAAAPLLPSGPSVSASGNGDAPAQKNPRIDNLLDELARIDTVARSAGRTVTAASASSLPNELSSAVGRGLLRIDDAGRVQVFVETESDPRAVAPALEALGMTIELTHDGLRLVQGELPIASLGEASKVAGVLNVRRPDYPVLHTGSVTAQSDAILNAASLRAALNLTGAGVRVGVIADGVEGMAASQASGDLAAVDITTCNAINGFTPLDPGAGAEGTAMLEIVHDLAPGAQLYYGNFGAHQGGTVLNFMNAVNCLAQNTDVVVDDVGFVVQGPYDGTSAVSMNTSAALNNPSNRIRGYYTAVGNFALNHYEEPYAASGTAQTVSGSSYTFHQFQATANTTDGGSSYACPVGGGACGDRVQLANNATLTVFLEWNDPWGNATNDYDLLLRDATANTISVKSGNSQSGAGNNPVEAFSFTNTTGGPRNFDIVIGNFQGTAAPKAFDMFVVCTSCTAFAGGAQHNFNTIRSSVPNNSDAGGGVLSTGAIDYADPGNDTIEPYSGWGPTNDGRTKPDVTGIDGVSVTGNGGFPTNFFGTSATSEEAGAIAALILSCVPPLRSGEPGDNPVADRTTLRNAILNSSIDLGAAGVDNTFGHGRLNAQAAAAAAGCTTQQVTLGGADLDGGGVRNSLTDRLAMPATITVVLLLAGALQLARFVVARIDDVTP